MNSIMESAIFAAIMTLRDELKRERKEAQRLDTPQQNSDNNHYAYSAFDSSQSMDKLVQIVHNLFNKADEVCGTSNTYDAREIMASLVEGVLFEAIDSISISDNTKIRIFDYARDDCRIEEMPPGNMLFPSKDNELPEMLIKLRHGAATLILAAAMGGNDMDALSNFGYLFGELMINIERGINEHFPGITIPVSPAKIAIETLISAVESKMAEMREADPSIVE